MCGWHRVNNTSVQLTDQSIPCPSKIKGRINAHLHLIQRHRVEILLGHVNATDLAFQAIEGNILLLQ